MFSFILTCINVPRRAARIIANHAPRPRVRRPRIGRRLAAAATGAGVAGGTVPATGGPVCFLVPDWGGDAALLSGIPPAGYLPPLAYAGLPQGGMGGRGLDSSGDYAALDRGGVLGGYAPVLGVSVLQDTQELVQVPHTPIQRGGVEVPEPAALGLFVVGLLLLAMIRLARP